MFYVIVNNLTAAEEGHVQVKERIMQTMQMASKHVAGMSSKDDELMKEKEALRRRELDLKLLADQQAMKASEASGLHTYNMLLWRLFVKPKPLRTVSHSQTEAMRLADLWRNQCDQEQKDRLAAESRLTTEIETNKALNLAKDAQVLRYKAETISLEASCIRFYYGVCFFLALSYYVVWQLQTKFKLFLALSSTCPDQLERDKLMKRVGGSGGGESSAASGGGGSSAASGGRRKVAKKSAAKPPAE